MWLHPADGPAAPDVADRKRHPVPANLPTQATTEDILRRGSKSFHAASQLLPAVVRQDAAVLYAFCRLADDCIDDSTAPERGLQQVRAWVEAVFGAKQVTCRDVVHHPAETSLTQAQVLTVLCALRQVVQRHRLPKIAFLALLEGFAWDVAGRRYASINDVHAYCVRVA
ncbi:MAG: phytoene/squalene synthase family protein, partial [Polyangiales bacterium]